MNDITLDFLKHNFPVILENLGDANAAVIVCIVPYADDAQKCLLSIHNAFPDELLRAARILVEMCVDKGYDTKSIKKALKK